MLAAVAMGVAVPLSLKRAGVLGAPVVAPPETSKGLGGDGGSGPARPGSEVEDVKSKEPAPVAGGKPADVYPALQPKPTDGSPEKPLFVRGYAWLGRKLRVLLSDGRTLTERDGVIAQADSTGVTLKDGTRIWTEQIKPKEKPVEVPPVELEEVPPSSAVVPQAGVQVAGNDASAAPAVPSYVSIPRTSVKRGDGGPRSGPRPASPSLVRGADSVTSGAR